MSVIKPRAWLLGMLAMLLVGSFATASAEAQGPFWYHRKANSQQVKGVKISGQNPEVVQGQGTEQKLKSKISNIAVEIVSKQLQVKGIIYNNSQQGQAKLTLVYIEPELVQPEGNKCKVTVGEQNTVKIYGHQAWTWDGTTTQLEKQKQQPEQKPDWIFLPGEIQQEATELPKSQFTNITITNGAEACGLLVGKYEVTGAASAEVEPPNENEWGTTETQKIIEKGAKQHFDNGKKNVGVTPELKLKGVEAFLSGTVKVKVLPNPQTGEQQEIAHYET